jgi:molybdopterin converting factor small subunit
MGRPSKYREEYAEQARVLCTTVGATDEELAVKFGVHVSRIKDWASRYPEFRAALKVGKGPADDCTERSLFQRANGFWVETEKIFVTKDGGVIRVPTREFYPPDTTACIFWLKNRRPDLWRDKHDFNVNGTLKHDHQLTINLATAETDEVQREYAEALGAAAQVQLLPPPTGR